MQTLAASLIFNFSELLDHYQFLPFCQIINTDHCSSTVAVISAGY